MKRYPTARYLATALGVDDATARQLRTVLTDQATADRVPAVVAWERQCYNRPSPIERTMCALDAVLGTHGVEAIRDRDGDCVAEYCNTGDTYGTTLLYDRATGTVRVMSWGDFVERYERRHGRLP